MAKLENNHSANRADTIGDSPEHAKPALEHEAVKAGEASILRRVAELKLSGRRNEICQELLVSLGPAERDQVDLLTNLALAAVFELKDALYGDDLPDITLCFRRLVSGDGHVALGLYSPSYQDISLDPVAALGYEDAAKEFLETLVHEFVHYWCHHKGISDGEPVPGKANNKFAWFHNARFRQAAREHGLVCSLGEGGLGGNGFDRTSLTDETWKLIRTQCPVTSHYLAEAEKNFL